MNGTAPKLQTNLNTDFLKLIAIISMVIDHVGGVFFPQYPVFRWFGRLAFPIFCYCLTVGMLYTRDIKKYLGRLALFALISQPFWILAFNSQDVLGNIFNLNIFFTLLVTLWAVWGFKERKWWIFIIGTLLLCFINFDYSITGLILMMIFYLCRNNPRLGCVLYLVSYLPALWNGSVNDPLSCVIGRLAIDFSFFSVFAAPLIFLKTNVNIKINKWVFYGFYPLHLLAIYLVRTMLFA